MTKSHIAIVGAGITGITTAYSLIKRGHQVTVFDAHRYAAMETSFANGGQLSASNGEVWNSWATVMKGMKWMFQADAPLLMHPAPSWHKYSWMAEFVGAIGGHKKNTIDTVRMAIAAREHLFSWAKAEGIDFDLEQKGILHIYDTEKALNTARKGNALLTEAGLDRFEVGASELSDIEPALTRSYAGGFFTPSDASGDIHKFTRGLSKAFERMGGKIVYGANVDRIVPEADGGHRVVWTNEASKADMKVDAVVISAGVKSRQFAADLGDRINIYPVKGYSITVQLDTEASQAAAPHVSLLDEDAKIVASRLGQDRYRVAGTAEFCGYNKDITAARVRPLTEWVHKTFPGVETDRVTPWAGLRPMTPDMMPRVKAGRRSGIFYNTGHGHLGWTLSAATAEMIAEQVDGWSKSRESAPHFAGNAVLNPA